MKLGKNVFELDKDFMYEIQGVLAIAHLDKKPLESMGLKLFEEAGEVAESINVNQGHLNKNLSEPIENEIADCFNCLLTILAKSYPNKNVYELTSLLVNAMQTKNLKYKRIIGAVPDTPPPVKPVTVNSRTPPEPWYYV